MFDNGNFRRRRKRRSDGPEALTKTKDKSSSCSALQNSDQSNMTSLGATELPYCSHFMNDCKSPSLDSSRCFSKFVSTMNATACNRHALPRQLSSELGSEFTYGRPNGLRLSSCPASSSNPVSGFEFSSQSHCRVNYYAAAGGQSSWFSPPVLSTISVNNLIYSREGAEI